MGHVVNGTELETDEQGYLLEPDYSDDAVQVIAAASSRRCSRGKASPSTAKAMSMARASGSSFTLVLTPAAGPAPTAAAPRPKPGRSSGRYRRW